MEIMTSSFNLLARQGYNSLLSPRANRFIDIPRGRSLARAFFRMANICDDARNRRRAKAKQPSIVISFDRRRVEANLVLQLPRRTDCRMALPALKRDTHFVRALSK